MPPGERDGEARGVVHADDAGVAVLALEKGRDEAHGRAGGEEEDYAVALLPGSPQRHFWLCFVMAGVRAGAIEGGCGLADRESTRPNSRHGHISSAVSCLQKKKTL